MSVKVIATDLDGTLFYPKHRFRMLGKKYLEFLRSQVDAGNKVVLVTGRSHEFCKKVEEKIGRPVDLVCCNGAYIRIDGQVVQDNGLDHSVAKAYADMEEKYGLSSSIMMIANETHLMINSRHSALAVKICMAAYKLSMGVYSEKYKIISDETEKDILKNGKVYKLMLLFGISRKSSKIAVEAANYLQQNYKGIEAAFSERVVEITPNECTKSNGLLKVRDYYGLTNDDFYVVGDSGNDIPMFKTFFDHSFCMARSGEHVRCHAKHTIRRVSDLAEYLK